MNDYFYDWFSHSIAIPDVRPRRVSRHTAHTKPKHHPVDKAAQKHARRQDRATRRKFART